MDGSTTGGWNVCENQSRYQCELLERGCVPTCPGCDNTIVCSAVKWFACCPAPFRPSPIHMGFQPCHICISQAFNAGLYATIPFNGLDSELQSQGTHGGVSLFRIQIDISFHAETMIEWHTTGHTSSKLDLYCLGPFLKSSEQVFAGGRALDCGHDAIHGAQQP